MWGCPRGRPAPSAHPARGRLCTLRWLVLRHLYGSGEPDIANAITRVAVYGGGGAASWLQGPHAHRRLRKFTGAVRPLVPWRYTEAQIRAHRLLLRSLQRIVRDAELHAHRCECPVLCTKDEAVRGEELHWLHA